MFRYNLLCITVSIFSANFATANLEMDDELNLMTKKIKDARRL